MPIFKVRPEQPNLPSRSSSVPPMHFHSPRSADTPSAAGCLPSVEEPSTPTKKSRSTSFAWSRLPPRVRDCILAHALVPNGPDTPIVIGLPNHYAHLKTIAVPMFLALGSWDAYITAASIFYQHVHIDLFLYPTSAKVFLTSPTTLRPRSLVASIQIRFTTGKDIRTFEAGHVVPVPQGKDILARMSIPTALRSMQTHGRLSELEFLLRTGLLVSAGGDGETAAAGGLFSSMARISPASWIAAEAWGKQQGLSGDGVLGKKRADVVVAPVFLASHSFQSAVLPLLVGGVFEKTRLSLQSVGEDGTKTVPICDDGDAYVRYWLGATVIELVDSPAAQQDSAGPRLLVALCNGDVVERAADVGEPDALPGNDQELVPPRGTRCEIVSSPITYPTSTSGSDTDSSSEEIIADLSALRHGSGLGEAPVSDDDTSSQGSNEDTMRELHDKFGVTSRDHGDTTPAGPSADATPVEDDSSSTFEDAEDDAKTAPAVHLETARAKLVSRLAALVNLADTMEESADRMEALARVAADRQLTSYEAEEEEEEPCHHEDTISYLSACRCMPEESSDESSSEDDEEDPGTPACEAPPADTADSSPSSGRGSGRRQEIQPADLSVIEGIFGARSDDAEHMHTPDTSRGSQDTPDIVPPQQKPPFKSKGTQTKRPRDGSPKAGPVTPDKATSAVPADHKRALKKKRKDPPAAADGQTGSSRAKRRKRARDYKEKQLRLAKRIEARAAAREKTLTN